MSLSTICLIVALVFAALMMLKIPEGPRLSYWGGVVFFIILSWLIAGSVLPLHR